MKVNYQIRCCTSDGIHWEKQPYSREFAPMKQLLAAANKLDKRTNKAICFVHMFMDDDITVYVATNEGGLHLTCYDASARMTVANGKVETRLHWGRLDMTHTVKLSRFNPEKLLLHFERCVTEARKATELFFQQFYLLDCNQWSVNLDISSAGAVRVLLVDDIHGELVYDEVHSLHELNSIPIKEIADEAVSQCLGQQIANLHQELAQYDDVE